MLLRLLADQKPGGLAVAIEVLRMRLFGDVEAPEGPAPELLECGRDLLAHLKLDRPASRNQTVNDHDIDQLVRVCLVDRESPVDSARAVAHRLAERIKRDLARHRIGLSMLLLPGLLATQPAVVLDVLLDPGVPIAHLKQYGLIDDRRWPAWLDGIPHDVLITWVRRDPAVRAPRIAALCRYEQASRETPGQSTQSAWTPLAHDLILACPDRLAVLRQFADRLLPWSWSGSRAAIVERRLMLLAPYQDDAEHAIAAGAKALVAQTRQWMAELQQQEQEQEQREDQQSQRFE